MKKIIENGMRRWDKEDWLTIAGILAIIGAVVIGRVEVSQDIVYDNMLR